MLNMSFAIFHARSVPPLPRFSSFSHGYVFVINLDCGCLQKHHQIICERATRKIKKFSSSIVKFVARACSKQVRKITEQCFIEFLQFSFRLPHKHLQSSNNRMRYIYYINRSPHKKKKKRKKEKRKKNWENKLYVGVSFVYVFACERVDIYLYR